MSDPIKEVTENIRQIVTDSKDDSFLYLMLFLTRKIRQGGWRGYCHFMVDEYSIKSVETTQKQNLVLLRQQEADADFDR